MAKGLGPRRRGAWCPSFTFAATAEVVALLGATPVFVDVLAESFNLDPASLEAAIGAATAAGLAPKAVIPVDLFGQPADYDAIEPVGAPRRPLDAVGRGAKLRRQLSRPQGRHDRRHRHHQLLSGEAAGLLRRRRRGLHR